jgi:hypothetical protein
MKIPKKYFQMTRISSLAIISVIMVSFILPLSHAQADEDKGNHNGNNKNKQEQSAIDTFLEILMANQAKPADSVTPATSSPDTAASSTPTKVQTPQSVSTTTSDTASSTLPKPEDRSNIHEPQPKDTKLEKILNENLQPEKPIDKNTPVKKEPVTSSNTIASTTPAGTINPTDPGSPTDQSAITGQNTFSPSNYYIPLDNLSPELTYALSFIALISGLSGAYLIVREPRTKDVWAPSPQFIREPLLEP